MIQGFIGLINVKVARFLGTIKLLSIVTRLQKLDSNTPERSI